MWTKLVLAFARYIIDYISQLNGAMYKELLESQKRNDDYTKSLDRLNKANADIDIEIGTITKAYLSTIAKTTQLEKDLKLSEEEFYDKYYDLKQAISKLSPDDAIKFDFGSTGSKDS